MISPDDGDVKWLAENRAELDRLEAEVANLKLQNDELKQALVKMVKMYSAETFCDVDCGEKSLCEHCTLEREVVGVIEKTNPEKRNCLDGCRCAGWCKYPAKGVRKCEVCGCFNQSMPGE